MTSFTTANSSYFADNDLLALLLDESRLEEMKLLFFDYDSLIFSSSCTLACVGCNYYEARDTVFYDLNLSLIRFA